MSNADNYAFGNCTYYVAEYFPSLPGNMGNAGDWIASAIARGYHVLQKPAPGTVVVYGKGDGYSGFGHVAVVKSVNQDGTFVVSEMNYSGYDVVDTRTSTMQDVIGFIVPPGEPVPQGASLVSGNAAGKVVLASEHNTPCGNCVNCLAGTNFLPNICFDKPVAIAEFLLGGALMLAGVAVLVAFALKGTKAGSDAMKAGGMLLGPAGKVATSAASSKMDAQREQKQQEKSARQQARDDAATQQAAHRQRMQRAQLRAARAKARTAEGKPRGGTSVAASARAKAKSGRFSDFTPEEASYAQKEGGASLFQ